MGQVRFTTTFEDGASKSVSATIVEDFLFSVQFRRLETYDGEFGFDWMRDEYKPESEDGEGISLNYEELKKGIYLGDNFRKRVFSSLVECAPRSRKCKIKIKS